MIRVRSGTKVVYIQPLNIAYIVLEPNPEYVPNATPDSSRQSNEEKYRGIIYFCDGQTTLYVYDSEAARLATRLGVEKDDVSFRT